MGLFSRKSSKGDAQIDLQSTNGSRSSSIRSPILKSNANGSAFVSPSLPDVTLPAPPDPKLDPAAYLRSIYAVRDRSRYVYNQAKRNKLTHFDVDISKFRDAAAYIVSIINVSKRIKNFVPVDLITF